MADSIVIAAKIIADGLSKVAKLIDGLADEVKNYPAIQIPITRDGAIKVHCESYNHKG